MCLFRLPGRTLKSQMINGVNKAQNDQFYVTHENCVCVMQPEMDPKPPKPPPCARAKTKH